MSADKELGILVLGHKRPEALRNVLESLRCQGALGQTQVWLDGQTFSPPDVIEKVETCRALAAEYAEACWRPQYGRLGIDKLMFDGLGAMAAVYDKIMVIEDDCFPTARAVETFSRELDGVANDPEIYSVYGHHFKVPAEGETITRFQGWGWGTTRQKLLPVLKRLKELFLLPEAEYLAWVRAQMTPELEARLLVTPGRDVTWVLERFFVWDAATTFVTALAGLKHKKTPVRTIYNCGLGPYSSHFFQDEERLRNPPWNMVAEDEVWDHFEAQE